MIPSRYRRILEALRTTTLEKKLNWSLEDGQTGRICAETGTSKVGIMRLEEEVMFMMPLPGTICAELTFMDTDGTVFDSYKVYSTGTSEYKELSDLYEIAKLSATQAIEKLEAIHKFLKDL